MGAVSRYVARRYLERARRDHIKKFPQLACFSFDLISSIIALDGQYEKDQLEFLSEKVFPVLDAEGVCIDVGANIGNHSVHFARHFRQVISLEPHPRNFALLSVNSGLAENILPLNVGASTASETIEIVEDHLNLSASSIHRREGRSGKTVVFEVARIDEMPDIQSAGRISFMKFDIEGHEAAAIEGARDTISRDRPTIMLEVLRDEISAGTSASLEALRALGYTHFHEPVEAGWIGKLPRNAKKFARATIEFVSGQPVSKAGKLVSIESLEKRNYLMVLFFAGDPPYA